MRGGAAHSHQLSSAASRHDPHEAHRRLAPHAGRARGDAEIAHSARRRLQSLNDLPRHTLEVAVDNHWIRLSGEVTWDYQRRAALSALRELPGVAGISDRVLLAPSALALAIRYEIEAELRIRAGQRAQGIVVAITRDDVSLSGSARSQAERDFACRLAAATPGVRRVIDNISIMPASEHRAGAASVAD